MYITAEEYVVKLNISRYIYAHEKVDDPLL